MADEHWFHTIHDVINQKMTAEEAKKKCEEIDKLPRDEKRTLLKSMKMSRSGHGQTCQPTEKEAGHNWVNDWEKTHEK